jgi:acyl-coenzyme A thioesterase PaaI-like protein
MTARRRDGSFPATSQPTLDSNGRRPLETWLTRAAFNTYFRFRLRDVGAGRCTVEARFRDAFEHPGGTISGPVFMAAADVATWFAVATLRSIKEQWVTADLQTAFLRAGRREAFTCTARVLKLGRQLAYVVAQCTRQDGTPLTHHTAIYARMRTRGRSVRENDRRRTRAGRRGSADEQGKANVKR